MATNSRWIRRIGLAAGGVLLLLLVALAMLVASFDANRLKALAVDWMASTHQRTLAIAGPIELSLLPRLAVKVSTLRLSERGRDEEFLAVDELSLSLRPWPLLRRQLVVGQVSARGLRARYQRDAQGVRNVDDLLSAGNGGPAGGNGTPASGADALRFDVSAVRLEDLRLHVQDEPSDIAGDVVLASLTAGRLAHQVASPVSVRASVQLARPRPATLSIDGRMTLTPDLDDPSVSLEGVALQVEGQGAGIDALSMALEGALAWRGGTLRAGPLRVALARATVGATTLAPSTLDIRRLLFASAGQRLELADLKLALAARRGTDAYGLTLAWPQLAVDAQQLTGSALSGKLELGGTMALTGDFRTAAPGGNFDRLRLPGLNLVLAGGTGQRKVDLALQADLLLHLAGRAFDVEGIALRATLADPQRPPRQWTVHGSGGASTGAAHWTLNGALDTGRFETRGEADLARDVPRIEASAQFDALDLNPLLPPDPPVAAGTSPAAADAPLPLQALRRVDGRFNLAATALSWRQYRASDVKLAATLDGGSLRIGTLTGRAWGGRIDASGSADASSQRLALTLDAQGVNVNALLQDIAHQDLLEGTGHIAAKLSARGTQLAALRSSLDGVATVRLRDGAVKGIDLARVLRRARAALSLKQDALSRASGTEKTAFSSLSASARIQDGVAHSDDLDLRTPLLRIGGAGRFDIGRGRVDYTARATVVALPAGQGMAELEPLRGTTVPVVLSGPFDAIDWKVQWSAVAEAAVKAKLKDKLAETLAKELGLPRPGTRPAPTPAPKPAKPEDLLKDSLKRLFK